MEEEIYIERINPKIEDRMSFASSCVECAARNMNTSTSEMYKRMKEVNLIEGYILKHYEVLHTLSRENVTQDIIGCLLNWEAKRG